MGPILAKNRAAFPGDASNLLLGFETSDDAAVWRITDETAAVLTLDFLTPLVDDPYDFGYLAAANALSDIFAMGATPVCALNVLALDCGLGAQVAAGILEGGAQAVTDAGAMVVGGHTIDDDEPKYGLAVFGLVHPEKIIRNGGAQPGDKLYLTKPLGVGIMSAAKKIGMVDEAAFAPVVASMKELNAAGGHAMQAAGVHAGTDVTGFGLAGHLREMLQASGVSVRLNWENMPLFPQVEELAKAYCLPNRTFAVMDFVEDHVLQGALDRETFECRMGIICDPQTSGGMLAAVPPEHAAAFEEAFERESGRVPACIGTFYDDPRALIAFEL